MLIAEINGVPASTHPAGRLFIEEGFAATAMGLQARTERLRPSGFEGASGTRIAGDSRGGLAMEKAGHSRSRTQPHSDSTYDADREPRHDDDDEAVRHGGDVDPDSAAAEIDRDDTVEE